MYKKFVEELMMHTPLYTLIMGILLMTIGCDNHAKAKRVTTSSGLQYEIIHEAKADARAALRGNTVTVHYTGWLSDNGNKGKKFDSSVDRGTPFSFTLGQGRVIAGWEEGVEGMKVGEKRTLIIPATLGYGASGVGGVIPGGATLIFEVELLSIK